MKTIFHPSDSRGYANHGWLEARYSFSFAGYYDPSRIHFGVLRVLNDDIVAPKMGFGMHPHDNMEIITIPLEGELSHKDSMGNQETIHKDEVQVMSAGTGIMHSEFNSGDIKTNLLQIWVMPKLKDVTPRYEQNIFNPEGRVGKFQLIVAPTSIDGALAINQDAYFSIGNFSEGQEISYTIKQKGNGIYLFVIEGSALVNSQTLNRRDGLGISETDSITISTLSNATILLMEIPMTI